MNVLVIGVCHSGTRLVSCLLERHPGIATACHFSQPTGNDDAPFVTDKNHFKQYDKTVIVSREDSCNERSIKRDYGSHPAHPWASVPNAASVERQKMNQRLQEISQTDPDYFKNNIIFCALEALIGYEITYLKHIFTQLNLDPETYDYNLCTPYHKQRPPIDRWIQLNTLEIRDCNKKYFRLG